MKYYRSLQLATFNGKNHILVTENVVHRAVERRFL
jgi:hypothetical protein